MMKMPDLIYILGVASGVTIALAIETVVSTVALIVIRLIDRRTK